MTSLFDKLSKISEQIQEQLHLMKNNESATILVSIHPFVRALGYNTQNLAEVQPEYPADPHSSGTDRVDYVIKRAGKPIIVIEVKSAGTKLNQHHWKQLHSYFVALDVEFGVLTNGIEYRFYTDLKKRNVMDEEPFLDINMDKLDPSQVNALEGFSKSRYAPDQTVRKIKISNMLEKELNQPSDEFVKHFAKQVHSGPLFQSKIQEYRPLVKRAWDDLVDQEIARRLRRHEELEENPPETQAEPIVVDEGDSESEASEPARLSGDAIPVFGYYKGQKFEAELLLDNVRKGIFLGSKCIRYNGELMKASHATWLAIRSVNPTWDSANWDKEKINSWEFWHVLDPLDGSERILRLVAGWKQNRDEALYKRILKS